MLAEPENMWLIYTVRDAADGYGTKMSPRNPNVSLVESKQHVINPTNLCGTLDDGIEHRLHIRRRATDDAEHLSRCRLMLQGLAQFCVPLLDLFEQPDVLDGNDGLSGESFQQLDLFFGKRTYFVPANHYGSNGVGFAQQWGGQYSAMSGPSLKFQTFRKLAFRLCGHVVNV